jgi:hypothetical protein
MINAIKRIWVPKKLETQPAELVTEPPAAPVPAVAVAATPAAVPAPAAGVAVPGPAAKAPDLPSGRNVLFEELPKPEVLEKNSDSVWAAFESVHKPEIEHK